MTPTEASRPKPHIYGHRGAPGSVPENTLGSYALAARMGVEAVEFDLVATKEGVLVDRHEPNLAASTDVAKRPEFADRRREITMGERTETGWFTIDFTVEELKTLRASEPFSRLRRHTMEVPGEWRIPTLDEILALRAQASAERGWELGLVIELKHACLWRNLGVDAEAQILDALERHGLGGADPRVRIESFELGALHRLRHELGHPGTLVFLVEKSGRPLDFVLGGDPRTYADLITPASLDALAETVEVIGPSKQLVIPRTRLDRLGKPTSLVADCHARGLEVTPWSFRAENHFLPAEFRSGRREEVGDYAGELRAYFDAGIDAAFCDQPDLAIAARDAHLSGHDFPASGGKL